MPDNNTQFSFLLGQMLAKQDQSNTHLEKLSDNMEEFTASMQNLPQTVAVAMNDAIGTVKVDTVDIKKKVDCLSQKGIILVGTLVTVIASLLGLCYKML